MKIIHDPVGSPHAPETQRYGLLGAFVAGAAAVRLPVRLTTDGYAAVLDDAKASTMTWKDLRALDAGEGFTTTDGKPFRYPSRVETFPMLLDFLPNELWYVIDVKPEADTKRRKKLVGEVVRAAVNRGVDHRVIVCSDESDARAEARRISNRVCVAASSGAAADSAAGLDAIVIDLKPFLADPTIGAKVRLGAIVTGATNLTPDQHSRLSELATVWGIVTNSILTTNAVARPGWVWIDEKWNQSAAKFEDVNANIWHLGYAKYNPEKFCHVYPDKGLHISIKPYDKDIDPPPTGDPIEDRLQRLEEADWNAQRTWPFYSGGGAGFAPGIRGDFSAEVDIESAAAQQATTVEMAAVNVDPSTHRTPWKEVNGKFVPNPPESFRGKNTFYDPHGAPPFAGVEHDEDDGWRINWNLGTEYDGNQYGKAVGDGKALKGRMRLDRRGNYWAAWYRPAGRTGPGDWVCVGAVRNDSLNEVIYLRLAGKRWRQEDAANPSEYVPVIPNHFTFRNFTLTRFV